MSLNGRFRNAEFLVPSDSLVLGRRNQVHEYPLRDDAYVEDLGLKVREYSFEAIVIGPGYEAARDKLIAALEEPGPGTLSHPDYGTLQVAITSARMRRNSRERGKVTFSISFVPSEGTPRYPSSTVDTAAAVETAADSASAAAVKDFTRVFSVEGQPAFFVTAIEEELYRVIAGVENTVGDISSSIAAEIRAPYNMATAIVGAIADIADIAGEPLRALQLYQGLFDTGQNSLSIPLTTSNRRQQASNTAALHSIIQRGAIIEAARTASATSYDTRNDALSIRDTLTDAIDAQMEAVDPVSGASIDDAIYQALYDLRTAIVNDLRTRGARLPELTIHTPGATLPALVIAYNLYGNADMDEEIITRNKIVHPGFVAGGEPLEVLADA